jgi:hypothetical protein
MDAMTRFVRHLFWFSAFVWIAAGAAQQSANVITADDLIKLSKEGIGDELIISMVRAAGRVPQLAPDEVIALKNQGVSTNVLTAVIQQQAALASNPAARAPEDKRRRIRVTASLHEQERGFLRRGGAKIDRTTVSWSLRATGWRGSQTLMPASTPNCPKDPLCKSWSPDDKCLEVLAPDSEEWKKLQSCYVGDKVTEFGQEYEVFDVDLPEAASDVELRIYYRDVENRTLSWFTRSTADSGKRVPGFARLRLWGAEDFDFKAHIQLFMSREGAVQDFRISECAVTNRDDAALERRLLSPDKQYCNVEQAPF